MSFRLMVFGRGFNSRRLHQFSSQFILQGFIGLWHALSTKDLCGLELIPSWNQLFFYHTADKV